MIFYISHKLLMICDKKEIAIGAHTGWSKIRINWKVYLPPLIHISLEASYITCKRKIFLN